MVKEKGAADTYESPRDAQRRQGGSTRHEQRRRHRMMRKLVIYEGKSVAETGTTIAPLLWYV